MMLILFAVFELVYNPILPMQSAKTSMLFEKLPKRTEAEWICTRCRLPAEGSYCTRCGQIYEKPLK